MRPCQHRYLPSGPDDDDQEQEGCQTREYGQEGTEPAGRNKQVRQAGAKMRVADKGGNRAMNVTQTNRRRGISSDQRGVKERA